MENLKNSESAQDKNQELNPYILEYVKERSNWHGNHSELLFDRLKTQEYLIRLANMYYEHILTNVDIDSAVAHLSFIEPKDCSLKSSLEKELTEDIKNYTDFHLSEKHVKGIVLYFPKEKSIKYLVAILKDTIDKVFSVTVLDKEAIGGYGYPGLPGYIDPEYKNILKEGDRLTKNEISIIEAHEKGHGVRTFFGESDYTKKFENAFDFDSIKISPKVEKYSIIKDEKPIFPRREKFKKRNSYFKIKEYESSNYELIERMSQLKNYFGMTADEEFTKEHLLYARENYRKDYGDFFGEQTHAFFL